MSRNVFYSFHFKNDFARAQQIRNINAIHGQTIASPNDWEKIKRTGDASIKKRIASQLKGRSCVVVLVGSQTASRRWVRHEIVEGWNAGKGVLGIHINKLKDLSGLTSNKGENPFGRITLGNTRTTLAGIAPLKTPTGASSQATYASISQNLEAWIEEAIMVRQRH